MTTDTVSPRSILPSAHLPGAANTPPAFSDTALAARYGAPWACTITLRELQRAKKKDTTK